MECKYKKCQRAQKRVIELIDTLWNVNSNVTKLLFNVIIELIDTLWNVNFTHFDLYENRCVELIDTLWNVNPVSVAFFGGLSPN